jgi:biopolymer transport protein ExbD
MSHRRWAVHEESDEAAEAELNLVPYLDIMVNLVIFLLFTFQVVIEVCRIDLVTPAYGEEPGTSTQVDPKKLVTITVAVHKTGYTLLSDNPEMTVIDIPLKRVGQEEVLDTERLRRELATWKENFDLAEGLVMVGSDTTEYSDIVLTMDAIREYKGKPFFPDIVLAQNAGVVRAGP